MSDQSIRLLLVEDDATDHELIRRCLSNCHKPYQLTWKTTVGDGLEALSSSDFDAVLTDLSLPDSFGLETVSRIRNCDADMPIVVLTTLEDRNMELQTLDVGVQDYLLKSEVTKYTLERAVDHARRRQQSVVENQQLLEAVESQAEMLAEQKELLEKKNLRLRKLYKTAHRFVDNLSHEFRTPLTVIKDYISLVREGMVGEVNDEQRRMLDVAGVRADDLNNMVDDMLDVTKLESGILGAWRRNCRVSDVVGLIRPGLTKKAEVKSIAFEIAVGEQLPEIYGDVEKLGRVVINLVTNAMKFCGEPGVVRLWAREDASRREVVVGVTDNGPGINSEDLSVLFERFKQLNTNIKSSTKGFGLGLNIARELVDLNFGEIEVESEVGHGATFSFTIPMANPREVTRRYLDRINRRGNKSAIVSLVRTVIDPSISQADASDVDAFFNYLLRRNDLLLRCDDHEWLFVLLTPRCELENFTARAMHEFEKTNRNRPWGPLAPFQMNIEGSWNVPSEDAEILKRIYSDDAQEAQSDAGAVPAACSA